MKFEHLDEKLILKFLNNEKNKLFKAEKSL